MTTPDRRGIDHVLDAIDNALGWDGQSDAMMVRYDDHNGEDDAPGGVAAPPERHPDIIIQDGRQLDSWDDVDLSRPWYCAPAPHQHEFTALLDGWQEVGWFDVEHPFREAHADYTEAICTWQSAVPVRVVSTEVCPEGVAFVGELPAGALDLSPFLSHVSFGFNAEPIQAGFERAGAQVRDLAEACQRAAATVGERYREAFASAAEALRRQAAAQRRTCHQREHDEFMQRVIWGEGRGEPQGIVLSGQDREPGPRDRALAARRNRNTGPARNPHRHRGI